MFYDMPNATIEQIIERINSLDVPCNTTCGIEQVMTVPAEMQAVDSNLTHHMQNDELAAYGLRSTPVEQVSCVRQGPFHSIQPYHSQKV